MLVESFWGNGIGMMVKLHHPAGIFMKLFILNFKAAPIFYTSSIRKVSFSPGES